jgi:hypothetical protein
MLEAVSGLMGGKNRWWTMPWMVLMFGVLVIPTMLTTPSAADDVADVPFHVQASSPMDRRRRCKSPSVTIGPK